MTDIRESGRLTRLKLEGIESRPGESQDFEVVADRDLPDEPALIGRLRVKQ